MTGLERRGRFVLAGLTAFVVVSTGLYFWVRYRNGGRPGPDTWPHAAFTVGVLFALWGGVGRARWAAAFGLAVMAVLAGLTATVLMERNTPLLRAAMAGYGVACVLFAAVALSPAVAAYQRRARSPRLF